MPPLRVLFIFAHPDDESMGAGALVAKYAAEGVKTFLICATRGERGWQGDPKDHPGLTDLGRIRTNELMKAAKVLGLSEVHFLNYLDGDLDQAPHEEVLKKIVTHLRRIKPQVIVTFPPDGIYGHPDHIAISQFTTAACAVAADSGYTDLLNQPAYPVSKLYYQVATKSYVETLRSWKFDIGIEVDGVTRQHFGWEEWSVTTRITTADYWRIAHQAVLCHATQLVKMRDLLAVMTDEMHRTIWGTGSLYRAQSLVNSGRQVETDLFAGLRF